MKHIASRAIAAMARTNVLRRFADDAGASLIEYCLVLGLVSVAAFAALTLLGSHNSQSLSAAASALSS